MVFDIYIDTLPVPKDCRSFDLDIALCNTGQIINYLALCWTRSCPARSWSGRASLGLLISYRSPRLDRNWISCTFQLKEQNIPIFILFSRGATVMSPVTNVTGELTLPKSCGVCVVGGWLKQPHLSLVRLISLAQRINQPKIEPTCSTTGDLIIYLHPGCQRSLSKATLTEGGRVHDHNTVICVLLLQIIFLCDLWHPLICRSQSKTSSDSHTAVWLPQQSAGVPVVTQRFSHRVARGSPSAQQQMHFNTSHYLSVKLSFASIQNQLH